MPRLSAPERKLLRHLLKFSTWAGFEARRLTNIFYRHTAELPAAGDFAVLMLTARDALNQFANISQSLFAYYAQEHPILKELNAQPGVSDINAIRLFALIDIYRAPSPSHLWNYTGMGISDGKPRKYLFKGRLAYSAFAKLYTLKLALQIQRSTSPYKRIYNEYVTYYHTKHPLWTITHCKFAARRRMMQVFYAHLWLRWRTLEGLPIPEPKREDGKGYASRYNIHEYWLIP